MGIESKEMLELENEKKQFEAKASAYQNDIARMLTNGLGEDIKHALNNPIRITKYQFFKFKVKNIINRILDVL